MNDMSRNDFRTNNFDLVRLCAAFQVALAHGMSHLDVNLTAGSLLNWVQYVPGVPVFFFVSGFLISKSYETTGNLADYSMNRVLRIYPALIVCAIVSLLIVLAAGYLDVQSVGVGSVAAWFVAQVTILQFYNPEFLRGFGAGVINGSLWTIAVELQFYVLVPLVYRLIRATGAKGLRFDQMLTLLVLVFLGANAVYSSIDAAHWDTLDRKLLGVSFIPWFYMFLVGILAQRNFGYLQRLLANRALFLLAAYALACIFLVDTGLLRTGNNISPLLFLLLASLVLSCAYTYPRLSQKLLGRHDVSYGIYIYHMPIVNLFIFTGMVGDSSKLILALGVVALLAFLSWRLIERPALAMKTHAFYPISKGSS